MTCPHCGTRMHEVNSISRNSSMAGPDAQHGTANGWSCHNCGEWVEKPAEVFRPGIPSIVGRERHKTGCLARTGR